MTANLDLLYDTGGLCLAAAIPSTAAVTFAAGKLSWTSRELLDVGLKREWFVPPGGRIEIFANGMEPLNA